MGALRIADAMSSNVGFQSKVPGVQEFHDRVGHVSFECFRAKRNEEAVIPIGQAMVADTYRGTSGPSRFTNGSIGRK